MVNHRRSMASPELRRCPCGYDLFYTENVAQVQDVTTWTVTTGTTEAPAGGLGAAPLGSFVGGEPLEGAASADEDVWEQRPSKRFKFTVRTQCRSCHRKRTDTPTSGAVVGRVSFYPTITGYQVLLGMTQWSGLTDLLLEVRMPGVSYMSELVPNASTGFPSGEIQPTDPTDSSTTRPDGGSGLIETVREATLYHPVPGEYHVYVYSRSLKTRVPLRTVLL